MTPIQEQRAMDVLCEMISHDTTNPMGRERDSSHPVERPVVDFLASLFEPYDVAVRRQAASPIHENLVIDVPGEGKGPALLLESHMDTVPADDWRDHAFVPRVEGGDIIGRGACDDKGPLAAMVVALLDVLDAGERLPQPVTLVAAADEEYSQTGIIRFVEQADRSYGFSLFGEPTRNTPVIQHKGIARWDITARGRSAHSAEPERGRNAILDMTRVIHAIAAYEEGLQALHANPLLTGPRITVTMIQGGAARNIVPEQCTVAVDFRIMPGLDPRAERQKLIDHLEELDVHLDHAEVQVMMPPLSTSPDDPCVADLAALCSDVLGRPVAPEAAPYGTDAARVGGRTRAVVLGPGDIKHAHAIDERISVEEMLQGAEIYRRCLLREWPVDEGQPA